MSASSAVCGLIKVRKRHIDPNPEKSADKVSEISHMES